MDKKLAAYREYIAAEYKKLDHKKAAPKELIEYHLAITQHFQHERLVHLIVTVFFALLMLLCFISYLAISMAIFPGKNVRILGSCMGIITLILFVTTLFYIRHYYLLENGTEALEDMTRKLYGRDFYSEKDDQAVIKKKR